MRKGFTLIELLVAMSIGLMVIVGGTIAANNFNSNQKVTAATSQLAEILSLARNYAMTRQKPSATYAKAVEYVAVVISNTGHIGVYPGNNDKGIDEGTTYFSRAISIKDVTISPMAKGKIIFSVPEGKLVQLQGTKSVPYDTTGESPTISVTSVDTSDSKSINISYSGVVTEGESVVLPTDVPTAVPTVGCPKGGCVGNPPPAM